MSVRFQKTPRGEVAILPRKDYERLVARASAADEDVGTARIVARARKEIAGGGPLLPNDIALRMGNGENPGGVLREWGERETPGTKWLSTRTFTPAAAAMRPTSSVVVWLSSRCFLSVAPFLVLITRRSTAGTYRHSCTSTLAPLANSASFGL